VARLTPSEVLDERKRDTAALQRPIVTHGRFFLAGGTAVGLHLGNRLSRDLDWFTEASFDAQRLTQALLSLPVKPSVVSPPQADTARVFYGPKDDLLETSFIRYSTVPARPSIMDVNGVKLPVADLETLAAMKAAAIVTRGEKRDFYDIHAIARAPGWSMERFVEIAERRARISPVQLRLGLTYFQDADHQEPALGVSIAWRIVKDDLVRDVTRAFDKQRGRGGPER
jgi:hypothetical protein